MLTLKIRKVSRTRDGIKKAPSPLPVGEASGDYFKLKLMTRVEEGGGGNISEKKGLWLPEAGGDTGPEQRGSGFQLKANDFFD